MSANNDKSVGEADYGNLHPIRIIQQLVNCGKQLKPKGVQGSITLGGVEQRLNSDVCLTVNTDGQCGYEYSENISSIECGIVI